MAHRKRQAVKGDAPYEKQKEALERYREAYYGRHPDQIQLYKSQTREAAKLFDGSIHYTSCNKFLNGREKPTPAQCRIISDVFEVPIEHVLHDMGYPIIRDLAQVARKAPDTWGEKPVVVLLLEKVPQTREWQKTDWHSSFWKQEIANALVSNRDPLPKAGAVAFLLRGFVMDPYRGESPSLEETMKELQAIS